MNSETDKSNSTGRQFPQSVSTLEAARRLSVTVPTIQRWLDHGILRGWKTAGGHRRIALDSLDEYVRNRLDATAVDSRLEVLVVDDDPIAREFIAAALTDGPDGFSVREARDGFGALTEVARGVPALLVVDIRMPHMDGVAFLRHVLDAHPELRGRIVAISSGTGAELEALGPRNEHIQFMSKPLAAAQLRAVLQRMGAQPRKNAGAA